MGASDGQQGRPDQFGGGDRRTDPGRKARGAVGAGRNARRLVLAQGGRAAGRGTRRCGGPQAARRDQGAGGATAARRHRLGRRQGCRRCAAARIRRPAVDPAGGRRVGARGFAPRRAKAQGLSADAVLSGGLGRERRQRRRRAPQDRARAQHGPARRGRGPDPQRQQSVERPQGVGRTHSGAGRRQESAARLPEHRRGCPIRNSRASRSI